MGKTYKESSRDTAEKFYRRNLERRIVSGHENQDFRKINKRKKKEFNYGDREYEQERN